MTSDLLRLLSLRLAGLLAQGFLLVSATVLFAFGMLELFAVLAFIALTLAWGMRASASRAVAAGEWAANALGRGPEGVELAVYARVRAFRVRSRVRKARGLPRGRWDGTQALVTSLVWVAYLVFLGSVVAGG